MNELLTICIVNYNTADFILNTLFCLKKLTKNPYKVIIRDNNSNLKDFLKLKKFTHKISYISLYRIENFNYRGSMAHGIALNDLIKKIDTKYGVILDADFTFLHKNWDEILIDQLDSEHPIIGTQPPIGPNSKKPIDFPLMFGLLFDNDIFKKLKIDFRPKNPSNFIDTGYDLRNKYLRNKYRGKIIKYKNTRYYKKGPFRNVICAEYYLNGYSKIFGSHFGRGASLGAQKYLKTRLGKLYTISFFGIRNISKFFLKERGKWEKRKWIKICRDIINNTK
ncbi:MAG: glycosyltransferase [Promethearchaeota archaeon]